MDKALQTVVDSQAEFSSEVRACARDVGKENFLVVGEVVGEIPMSYVTTIFLLLFCSSTLYQYLAKADCDDCSALYFGRGKQPDQALNDTIAAMTATNESDPNK